MSDLVPNDTLDKGKQKVDTKLFALRQNRDCFGLGGLKTVDNSFYVRAKVGITTQVAGFFHSCTVTILPLEHYYFLLHDSM